MSQYYCPFCSSQYQFHINRSDGVLICGQCGDPLIKKPLVNPRRFFGLFLVFAFLAPLVIMILILIKDFDKDKIPTNSSSLVVLKLDK